MAEKSQSNPDPKTATEAKLCAYLEGDIAPADRAEIEKYLESNLAHKQLLTELKKTHGLLASLPRESAPPEIAEAFSGHLERSLLLDETDHQASVRRGRWPQRLAIAAIVFLTFCLGGLVVYIVLPGRPMWGTVATTTPLLPTAMPAAQNVTAMPPPAAAVPAKSNVTVAVADKVSPTVQGGSVVVESTPSASIAGGDDRLKLPGQNQYASASQVYLAAHPLEQKMLAPARNLALANDLPADSTVYMIVSTDNPRAAASDVRNFFQANSFAYKTAANASAGQVEQTGLDQQSKATFNTDAVTGAVQAVPTTQMNFALNQQQLDMKMGEKELGNGEQAFVARAMPRTLALELNDALSTQRPGQTSSVYYLPADVSAAKFIGEASPSPTTAPSDVASSRGGIGGGGFGLTRRMAVAATMPSSQPSQAIAADQPLTVTVDQLVGPGVDKTSNVRVGADGTINLPMIEPVPAAGLTAADLQREIADKYRQDNLIPDATVTVTLGLPTTQPIAPATMPVELGIGPATQPVGADRVNVVVLVQPTDAATTEPTTQPATSEPVQQ
jgi:protein involved in polysaccharide export with SLBB domain